MYLTTLLLGSAATAVPGNPKAIQVCNSLNFSMKVEVMHGFGPIDGYSRNSGCAYQCGRKTFRWDNGPQGFGDGARPGSTTQWPSCMTVGATWDPELALEWGRAMGEEFWNKGTNIQEGPGVNIARIPKNGRTFEYLSGEDPILGKVMVQPLVDGIQENVMAISKHYILNNQETHRSGVNEVVDEKTMMELYGPPFAAAAKKSAGFMCAYNRVNGVYACENKETLRTQLKEYYNFSGFVVSDWGACHSTGFAINNGLDIEMPDGKFFTEENIQAALDTKNITMDMIDESCVRILSGWYNLPEDKRHPCGGGICISRNVSTSEHKALARNLSSASTILLKNEGNLLPLDKSKTVVLIGPQAQVSYTAGQGSGGVQTNDIISPVSAFAALGIKATYEAADTVDAAVAAAKAADIAIVFGFAKSGEGHDRSSLNLEGNIDQVIPAVGAAQKNTVVVLTVPGNILTDWRDSVPAIVTNLLPGEQFGNALGDVLYGAVPPSGKLTVTFPNKDNEQGMTTEQYPGVKTAEFDLQANYSEGQIVGYRWYDKHNVKPAFGFGHGLTYGTFEYSDLNVNGRTVTFKVTRSAGTGCDVPQVYIGFPGHATDVTIPTKVLRYFQKTCDQETTVTYTFTDEDVSNWSVETKSWVVTTGDYDISVGTSSTDISLTGKMTV